MSGINYQGAKSVQMKMRAVTHKLRQQILNLLEENGKMTVTDLYIKLRIEQSVASQQLAILRHAGIVEFERQRKFLYYKISESGVKTLNEAIAAIS